jgi:hypothetical protein
MIYSGFYAGSTYGGIDVGIGITTRKRSGKPAVVLLNAPIRSPFILTASVRRDAVVLT